MANLNSLSSKGTRFHPDQLRLIDKAAGMKNVPRSVLIRRAATEYAKRVLEGSL